jgi:hypothetical protein
VGESSAISRAVATVVALDARRRRAMYGRAVAFGVANTQCSCERERQFGVLRLLTLSTLRLPDVALYGELLHAHAAERQACCLVAQTLIGACAGSMRLAHRALEMHALEVGYRADAWVTRAIEATSDQLSCAPPEDGATARAGAGAAGDARADSGHGINGEPGDARSGPDR